MKLLIKTFILFNLCSLEGYSQIGIGTTNPHSSSILEVESVEKGFLVPRMDNSKISEINNPSEGLMVYSTEDNCLYFHNSSKWISACTGNGLSTTIDFSSATATKVTALTNADESHQFGYAVSFSGDGLTAMVGEPAGGDGLNNPGAVYVYKYDGSTWIEEARILTLNTNSAGGFEFGWSLSLSNDGNTAIISTYNDSSGGSTYIFTRTGSAWTEQLKLTATIPALGDRFGWSNSISGDGNTAIIGAPESGIGGAVYIFKNTGTTWTQEAKLVSTDLASNDAFGYSVDISTDGNVVVIGAEKEKANGNNNAGSSYIFRRSGTTWTQETKLINSDIAAGDRAGKSVSMAGNGNTVVVGAPGNDDNGSGSGSAYVYTYSTGTWTEDEILLASNAGASDAFGESVDITSDGNTVIVGAKNNDANGSAYVFKFDGTDWTEEAKLVAPDADATDRFGFSVSISANGNAAAVGAFGNDDDGNNSGSAYLFK